MRKLAAGIAFLALFFIVLVSAIEHTAYDRAYYETFQRAHYIDEVTGRTAQELKGVSEDVISYLRNGDEALMRRNFGERETLHMRDVYLLFSMARTIRLASAGVLCLLLAFQWKKGSFRLFVREVDIAALVFLILFLGVAVLAASQFSKAFVLFHHLFFDNDLWLLNPETDLMIQMMPEPFFVGMAVRIAVKTALGVAAGLVLLNFAGHFRSGTERKECV
ncbi:MAG: TIGR01906 family membrane protein [Ndongobacter sp.]|nr:TIGR01906 family membrane protein [Ndongobacter sp.]